MSGCVEAVCFGVLFVGVFLDCSLCLKGNPINNISLICNLSRYRIRKLMMRRYNVTMVTYMKEKRSQSTEYDICVLILQRRSFQQYGVIMVKKEQRHLKYVSSALEPSYSCTIRLVTSHQNISLSTIPYFTFSQ